MAGKITIRRIGSIIPTLCLLLILVVCALVVWLSTLGLPDAALRYAEEQAAKHGVTLRLEALRLEPSRGLAVQAEGISLYADAQSTQPLLTVQSLTTGLNISRLLVGDFMPSFMRISGANLSLPVTSPEGEKLVVSDIDLAARIGRGSSLNLTSGKLKIQGIPVKVQGVCDLNLLTASKKESDADFDISKLLAEHQPLINQIYQHIEAQHWQPEELPSFTLRLDMQEEVRLSLRGNIPRFDIGQFHFREALLNLQHSKNTITINTLRFKTVEPDTSASFQGAYDVGQRRLSFTMESTAALVRMVRSLSSGALQEYLYKFRHPDDCPPKISLSGDVCLEEDYTLQSARVRGEMQQHELMVGSTKVDTLELSFFYNNGDFNINKLDLLFPDGSLQCIASAENGVGQAQVVADLPVQKMLTLANELSPEPINLPEGLKLGERVRLALHARLTTPAFVPGQTHWQGFVPSLHMIAAEIKSDDLEYSGYKLTAPELRLQIADIVQGANLIPRSIGSTTLKLKAESAELPTGDAAATLQKAELDLAANRLELGENAIPQALREAKLHLSLSSAEHAGENPLSVGEAQAELRLEHLSINEALELGSLRAALAEAHAQAAAPTTGHLRADQAELHLTGVENLAPLSPSGEYFSSAMLQASATGLANGDTSIGRAELTADLKEHTRGSISLHTSRTEEGSAAALQAEPDWTDPSLISLRHIRAELPADTLALALELLGKQAVEAEVPGQLSLSGECTLRRDTLSVQSGKFHLDIPELVRTPHKQPAHRGKRIPISLQADTTLFRNRADELAYRLDLELKHDTGSFTGHAVGSEAGQLRVNGSTTLRPDVADALIDSEDAHSIIRDFRFTPQSRTTISDIDARIDYSNGLKVDATCRVDLVNTEYLISVLEDAPNGTERMRQDLGSNPYTLISHATCRVEVLVRDECKAKNGSPLPNESLITISDVVMDYNNSPWLQRMGIKNGTRSSRLVGDTIIIDIERSFVELRNLRGTAYPAYALGMFYPDLQHYLEDVLLANPVQLEAPLCVFPIYDDCKRPMSGTIRVIAPEGAAFRFLGTTIPLSDFSGFVYLTDDYVLLDRMNAKCWEGVLDAAVKISISGKRTGFDGYAKAQCMNLKSIAAAYGSKQQQALCNGEIRFRTPSPDLNDIRAYGRLDIENGDLMSLSLFRPVGELITDLPDHFTRLEKEAADASGKTESKPSLFTRMFTSLFRHLGNAVDETGGNLSKTASYIPGLNHLIAYDLQEAHTNFDILNGHLITRDMKAKGYNLNVQLNLDINLNTLELQGNLWPRISSLPTILLAPLTFLSDFMVDIIVYGPVDDIHWRIGLDRRIPSAPPSASAEAQENNPEPRKKQ